MISNEWGFWTKLKPSLLFGMSQLKSNTTTPTLSEMGEAEFREQTPLKRSLSSAVVLLALAGKLAPRLWLYKQKSWFPTGPTLKIMPKIKGDCLSMGLKIQAAHPAITEKLVGGNCFINFLPFLFMLNLSLCLDPKGYSCSWETLIPFIYLIFWWKWP